MNNQTAQTTYSVNRLRTLLQQEQRKRKTAWIAWLGLMGGYCLLMECLESWLGQQNLPVQMLFWLLGWLIVLGPSILQFALNRNQTFLRASGWEDKRLVGPLVDAYVHPPKLSYGKQERRIIQEALTRALSRMTAQDVSLLTELQRIDLQSILKNGGYIGWEKYHHPELMAAAIWAFTRIADPRCLPQVQELARHAKKEQVRAAAQACLPTLQALNEQAQAGDTLLRAANTPMDSLLRPVQSGSIEGTQQLLRASKNETDSR